jgi:ubiquinone/menaquinone biosynthesis C-methylase UbiE
MVQERKNALLKLFSRQGFTDLSGIKALEIGCGSGSNLLELILFGATPDNLYANELLPERVTLARNRLPAAVHMYPGNAMELPFPDHTFDLVYQSTVFSSVLDSNLQHQLAERMWRWVRPGGGVLWYDFTVNNPRNADVRGVPMPRIHELFPDGIYSVRKVTLAPPIARAVVRAHPALYSVLNVFPCLRTHVLCYNKKS